MSYSIKTYTYQTKPPTYFEAVEKAVFNYANGGTWQDASPGISTLTIGGSGTSGILRFQSDDGKEAFFVALGVHNYKPWVDIVTGLEPHDTAIVMLPEYYNNVKAERVKAREAQRTKWEATSSKGTKIGAEFRVKEGHELVLDIVVS